MLRPISAISHHLPPLIGSMSRLAPTRQCLFAAWRLTRMQQQLHLLGVRAALRGAVCEPKLMLFAA